MKLLDVCLTTTYFKFEDKFYQQKRDGNGEFSVSGGEQYARNMQKNGAVSKVSKTFISCSTQTQRTLSVARTVRVSHALQQFASHAYCGAAGPVSKMASQQEKAFCVLRCEVSRSVITVQHEFRVLFKKEAQHKKNVTR
jgi:hypothetical protein